MKTQSCSACHKPIAADSRAVGKVRCPNCGSVEKIRRQPEGQGR